MNQRASRIRENQKRCRQRKAHYILSLEERIHRYESKRRQADLELQHRAQILKLENAKLQKILLNSTAIDKTSLEEKDADALVQEIKRKLELQAQANLMVNGQCSGTFDQRVDVFCAFPLQLAC